MDRPRHLPRGAHVDPVGDPIVDATPDDAGEEVDRAVYVDNANHGASFVISATATA